MQLSAREDEEEELEDNGGHTVYYHSIEDEEHQTDRQRVIRSHNILGH